MKRNAAAAAVTAAMLCGAMAVPARAAAPATCPGPNSSETVSFTGTFSEAVEGSHVMVPFDVPEGITRVRVRLCYDQPDLPTSAQIKHTLDLGIYEARGSDGFHDEDEFRGWGGSSRPEVSITPEQATNGFVPGPIPAGEWAAEIGVAAVAGQAEGDTDGTVGWRLEVLLGSDPADLDAPWTPAPYDSTPAATGAGWYAGDMHVHAEHSNRPGNAATMAETFDYAFGDRPTGAGLDFITLSDYVGSRHWGEIGRFQAAYPGKLIMRSAEVITYRGHTNNHASATYVDHRTGPVYELVDGELDLVRAAQPASRIFGDVLAAGGFTQVNHPTIFDSDVPGLGNMCRGCSWEYSDDETQWDRVDSLEVQTGPSGTYDPDDHELGPNPFTPLALQMYDDLRARGFDITAVGSSDSHDADHEELTQSPIGEATTMVYADELSEEGIQRAIEAGHAYVKFFASDGPDLRFDAVSLDEPRSGGGNGNGNGGGNGNGSGDGHGNGNAKGRDKNKDKDKAAGTAMMGDELEAASARFTARVLGAAPSPELRILLVLKDGVVIHAAPVVSEDFTFEFEAAGPGDYRLQLQRGSAIEALANPISLST